MDIQKVLTELNKFMTDREIANEIDAPESIVNRLRNGKHKTSFYDRVVAIKQLAERKGIVE